MEAAAARLAMNHERVLIQAVSVKDTRTRERVIEGAVPSPDWTQVLGLVKTQKHYDLPTV